MHRIVQGVAVLAYILFMGAGATQAVEQAGHETMDPEQAAAMEAAQTLGSPSEGHAALKPFAGTWTYELEWRLSPDAPVQPMTGSTINTLIYGGRFLKQEVSGEATADFPAFEGMGFTGYDNIREEYNSVWVDNMGTGIMKSTGQYDPATKTISEQGDVSCPMTGESHRKFRAMWKSVDENHSIYESYQYTPAGEEFKSMEIPDSAGPILARMDCSNFSMCHEKIREESGIWIPELVPVFEKLDALRANPRM